MSTEKPNESIQSSNNPQIQGIPQIQQQPQGIPIQQQPQGIPSNQMQGIPQLQQVQGYAPTNMNNNINMNNNFIPMQQQQQMPYSQQGYSAQGLNAQLSYGSSIGHSGQGFRLLKFPETQPSNPSNLETVSENKENDSEEKLKLAAVIITICDGSTYDSLFSTVKQDAGVGSRVAVYACQKGNIKDLQNAIKSNGDINWSNRTDDLQLLYNDLNEIEDESCVAINYECCSECSDNGFHGADSKQMMNELQFFLKQGFLVMYSDFSLKAFIKAWNQIGAKTELGPNPFIRTGTFSGSVIVNFNPYKLKTCISSQLQSVGELCPDQDFCTVHCMGSTVRYSVNKKYQKSTDNLPYDMDILTVTQFGKNSNSCSIKVPDFPKKNDDKKKSKNKKEKTESSGGLFSIFGWNKKKETKNENENVTTETKDEKKEENESKKDEKKVEDKELEKDIDATKLPMKTLWGDAGHVVLDFSKQKEEETEGNDKQKDVLYGKVLLSMTHWCELVKLGDQINDDVLFKVAAKNMGTSSKAYQEMQTTYKSFGGKNATGQQYQQQQAWISKTANMMVQQQAPCNNMMNSSYSKGGY